MFDSRRGGTSKPFIDTNNVGHNYASYIKTSLNVLILLTLYCYYNLLYLYVRVSLMALFVCFLLSSSDRLYLKSGIYSDSLLICKTFHSTACVL